MVAGSVWWRGGWLVAARSPRHLAAIRPAAASRRRTDAVLRRLEDLEPTPDDLGRLIRAVAQLDPTSELRTVMAEEATENMPVFVPSGFAAVDLWLLAGAVAGDESRRQLWESCAAQLALRDAVADNAAAAAALPPLDRIDQLAAACRSSFANDAQVLADVDGLPAGVPESLAALVSSLRAVRAGSVS